MSWQKESDELEARRSWSRKMGGSENVERQHGQGRFTIRERVDALVDSGSFTEVGSLTGRGEYDEAGNLISVQPAPYVMGIARINGRPVAIGGEDFTVRGGSSPGTHRRKGGQGGFIEDLASTYLIPLINLADGAGGSVRGAEKRGYTVFPGVNSFGRSVQLLGEVPVISAVLGTAAGGPAGRTVLSHWSVMVRRTSQIFSGGPPLVKRALGEEVSKEDLGGPDIAVDMAGTVDNAVDTERECLYMIRRFLSYMPQNVWELPPSEASDDPVDRCEEELLSILPRERTSPYRMHRLLELVMDQGSIFEIQPTFGRALITCLARLNGHPVGIVANNPMVSGGAMGAKEARKQTHFIELCDCFHIPLIFFVDIPGFMIGTAAEQEATLREGMKTVFAIHRVRVPIITLVIRKCYGMAGMATCDKDGLDFKIAWPSGEWGLPAHRGRGCRRLPAGYCERREPGGSREGTGGGTQTVHVSISLRGSLCRRRNHRSTGNPPLSVQLHRPHPQPPPQPCSAPPTKEASRRSFSQRKKNARRETQDARRPPENSAIRKHSYQ